MEGEVARVTIESDASVARWASTLGCTPTQLRHAVRQVGVQISDIREYLELAKMPNDPPRLQSSLAHPQRKAAKSLGFRRKRAWE